MSCRVQVVDQALRRPMSSNASWVGLQGVAILKVKRLLLAL